MKNLGIFSSGLGNDDGTSITPEDIEDIKELFK